MKRMATYAAVVLLISGSTYAFSSAGEPRAAAGALGVHLSVLPAWKDRVQYPTWPPPTHYRVVASVYKAGTRMRILAPELELNPGDVFAAEAGTDDISARMTARMNEVGDAAEVHVRVYSGDELVHESRASVSLEKPPTDPATVENRPI